MPTVPMLETKRADRTFYVEENKLVSYNYEGVHFRVFEDVWKAKEWIKTENNGLVLAEFESEYELDCFINSYEKKCLYCDNKQKAHHFACEICGVGMCDECYDKDVEHSEHYHLPLEDCDDDLKIKVIKHVCGNDAPAYICEYCMNKAMAIGKADYKAFKKQEKEYNNENK